MSFHNFDKVLTLPNQDDEGDEYDTITDSGENEDYDDWKNESMVNKKNNIFDMFVPVNNSNVYIRKSVCLNNLLSDTKVSNSNIFDFLKNIYSLFNTTNEMNIEKSIILLDEKLYAFNIIGLNFETYKAVSCNVSGFIQIFDIIEDKVHSLIIPVPIYSGKYYDEIQEYVGRFLTHSNKFLSYKEPLEEFDILCNENGKKEETKIINWGWESYPDEYYFEFIYDKSLDTYHRRCIHFNYNLSDLYYSKTTESKLRLKLEQVFIMLQKFNHLYVLHNILIEYNIIKVDLKRKEVTQLYTDYGLNRNKIIVYDIINAKIIREYDFKSHISTCKYTDLLGNMIKL